MRRSILPSAALLLDIDGQPYRRRDGRLVRLIQGGSSPEPPVAAPPAPTAPPTPPAPAPTPPVPPASATPPEDKGFPADTPVAEMTPVQQVAYWKDKSRKHESRALPANEVEELRRKAAAHDAAEAAKLTPSEQAIREARDAGKAEALIEANTRAAAAILKASLQARGKSADEINEITAAINTSVFIADGDVDTDKVAAFVNRIAGTAGDGNNSATGSGMGQGNRNNRANAGKPTVSDTAAAMGRALGRRPAKTNQ